MSELQAAALRYIEQGFCPVPVPAGKKGAILPGWQNLRIGKDEVPQYFGNEGNIGLLLGEPSGWLIDIDIDCEEALSIADEYLPATPAITGRPSRPGSHRWYIAEGIQTKRYGDPKNRSAIVEMRSTGGQTVVGPSVHPDGEQYDVLNAQPAAVPASLLASCVKSLANAVIKQRHGDIEPPQTSPQTPQVGPCRVPLEVDASGVEGRALAYLTKIPPAISGQGGHNATYAAATALVHGFGIEPERALAILAEYYNPKCQPPWSEKQLRHKVDQTPTCYAEVLADAPSRAGVWIERFK